MQTQTDRKIHDKLCNKDFEKELMALSVTKACLSIGANMPNVKILEAIPIIVNHVMNYNHPMHGAISSLMSREQNNAP